MLDTKIRMTAYTIGNEANYDKTLAEAKASGRPMRKTGKGDQGRDAEYPGGWVFDDIECDTLEEMWAAKTLAVQCGRVHVDHRDIKPANIDRAIAATLDAPLLLCSAAVFAVYELELPGTWDECTYVHDGARHLLVDAVIVRKIDEAWLFWSQFEVEVLALGGDAVQARAVAEQLIELTAGSRAAAKATVLESLMRGRGRE
jgi:hypothetical protein